MNAFADVHYLTPSAPQQLSTRFDEATGAYWAFMNPRPRACFNLPLLAELEGNVAGIIARRGKIVHRGIEHRIKYAVLASAVPNVFNLGGDLALFRACIEARDRAALVSYGERCVDNLYPWHRNCELPLTTISLVQGEALGGGFEAALSASVLIAEESARMGFPEILFNMFPGMGAFSFLVRKVGRRTAEELITSGAIYTARQLFEMGVVDVITADGTGEAAVEAFIRKHARSGNGRQAFEQARNEVQPVTRDELMRVVGIWADAALRLQDRDLRMMERLVRAQQKIGARDEAEADNNVLVLQAAM
jgi:DSF synthase